MKDKLVSALRDFRPRLDEREINYFIHVLRCRRVRLWEWFRDYCRLEAELWRLRTAIRRGKTYPEGVQIGEVKKKLELYSAEWLESEDRICRNMIRRLQAWLKGEFIYPNMFAEYSLTCYFNLFLSGTKNT